MSASITVKAILNSQSSTNDRDYVARTGDRWIVMCDIDGTPAYDACGATIEEALAALAWELAIVVALKQGEETP